MEPHAYCNTLSKRRNLHRFPVLPPDRKHECCCPDDLGQTTRACPPAGGEPEKPATGIGFRFSPLVASTNAVVQTTTARRLGLVHQPGESQKSLQRASVSGSPPWPQARMLLSRRLRLDYSGLSTSRGELEAGQYVLLVSVSDAPLCATLTHMAPTPPRFRRTPVRRSPPPATTPS